MLCLAMDAAFPLAAAPRVMDQGVMLNMAVAQGRVTFQANLVAAHSATLNLNSKLLHLIAGAVR